MIGSILKKIVGSKNERELKRIQPIVNRINELEPSIKKLSDQQLKSKTAEFKERLSRGETLDELLPEAFATVRETARRTLGERHFDVQLIGGVVLHEGKIAEMKTGEGKTLVATLPVYLNALEGHGVHVVTVNDYLARRDAEWMGVIYNFLGMEVGVIVSNMPDSERYKSYRCDITYGTNNEFGFDYLRDNMKFSADEFVQRELYYAIVDEVDSILIDEARTPLIISGPSEESTDKYYRINRVIPQLIKEKDYTVEEKSRTVALTEAGVAKVERILKIDNLYDPRNVELVHHVNQALKAHVLFKKDVDYVVKNGEVIIVDEFTGRLMPGRRYSEGLHQALEAKEHVKVERENQTLATITFQNYFRMYKKLAGMTGTADTEAVEFHKIYNLEVIVVPTNLPMIRKDYPDMIYKTEKEKFNAVIREIIDCHKRGQPVLVGTVSIEKSERLSKMLKKRGIPHQVLNAKHHEREAQIIAQAGRKGAVTISTNMAGRGTDILLGGNPKFLAAQEVSPDDPEEKKKKAYEKALAITSKEKEEVIKAGGLHIIGTERHESRRIDNQLRGRSGRQGDPGSSRFYLSLEDDLLRIFGSERISSIMDKLGIQEDEPIQHNLITKAIENAQRRVEAYNFEIRKHLLEYDDVMNKQREVIYKMRRDILTSDNIKEQIIEIIEDIIVDLVDFYLEDKKHPDLWNWEDLEKGIYKQFGFRMNFTEEEKNSLTKDDVIKKITDRAKWIYDKQEKDFGSEVFREIEKFMYLQSIDSLWKDHLLNIDHLKEGIGLRGYAQKDPLIEYKTESYQMFVDMVDRIKEETVEKLFTIRPVEEKEEIKLWEAEREQNFILGRGKMAAIGGAGAANAAIAGGAPPEASPQRDPHVPVRRKGKKIGRNDPCPCGSGKKYKKCCGR
ncbi:MAG: preprotein translocase subunit SecA [Deltaproteobacteria bacterium]|nr:preprotein translocase subunit SecA [Deltaproteobacteria bacterium]